MAIALRMHLSNYLTIHLITTYISIPIQLGSGDDGEGYDDGGRANYNSASGDGGDGCDGRRDTPSVHSLNIVSHSMLESIVGKYVIFRVCYQ